MMYNITMIKCICSGCGKIIFRYPCRIKQFKHAICSKKCFKAIAPKGKTHYNWKNGRRKCKGYMDIFKPNHPNAKKNGYIAEHRYVMSKFLKRPLTKDEFVHHVDGVRTNNKIKNLKLMNKKLHNSMHRKKEAARRTRNKIGRFI